MLDYPTSFLGMEFNFLLLNSHVSFKMTLLRRPHKLVNITMKIEIKLVFYSSIVHI